jgi:hypothetical protein
VTLGDYGFFSSASDTGTSLLGSLTANFKDNEYGGGAYRIFTAGAFYDILSNSTSTVVTKKMVSIPFKLTDKNGENPQEGKVVKITPAN